MADEELGRGLFPKSGERPREVSVPEGHSFACEGEAAVDGGVRNPEPRRRSVLDKRTLLEGRPGSAGRPLMRRFVWRGYCATNPSIAQLLQVGSHRSLLLHPTCVGCLCRCLSTLHRLISTTWIAGSAGPMRGCYVLLPFRSDHGNFVRIWFSVEGLVLSEAVHRSFVQLRISWSPDSHDRLAFIADNARSGVRPDLAFKNLTMRTPMGRGPPVPA